MSGSGKDLTPWWGFGLILGGITPQILREYLGVPNSIPPILSAAIGAAVGGALGLFFNGLIGGEGDDVDEHEKGRRLAPAPARTGGPDSTASLPPGTLSVTDGVLGVAVLVAIADEPAVELIASGTHLPAGRWHALVARAGEPIRTRLRVLASAGSDRNPDLIAEYRLTDDGPPLSVETRIAVGLDVGLKGELSIKVKQSSSTTAFRIEESDRADADDPPMTS